MVIEYIVWVVDSMGRHFKEEVFTSYKDAYVFGCHLANGMSLEEDWYIECHVKLII